LFIKQMGDSEQSISLLKNQDQTSTAPPSPIITYEFNQILYGEKSHTFFIPAYLVVLVKKIGKFNLSEGTVNLSMTLVLRVKVSTDLPRHVYKGLKSLKVRLNESIIIVFDKATSEVKEIAGDDLIAFTQRLTVDITFKPDLTSFPFDRQYLNLKFELTSFTVGDSQKDDDSDDDTDGNESKKKKSSRKPQEKYSLRFNFHVNEGMDIMLRFKGKVPQQSTTTEDKGATKQQTVKVDRKGEEDTVDEMPDLNIAYGLLLPPWTPEEGKSNIVYYPVTKMRIPLFREPEYVLLSSCLPLFVLNVTSLGIFAVNAADYGTRLGNIITILLALFAFLPTYRAQVPNPTITSLDVAMFASVIVLFLIIVDSVMDTVVHNPYFILQVISGAIVLLVNGYFIVMYAKYLRNKEKIEKFMGDGKKVATADSFDFSSWRLPSSYKPPLGTKKWVKN